MRRVSRSLFALVVVCVVASILSVPLAAGDNAARARLAYAAMQRTFLDRQRGDYREWPRGRAGSHAWPYSQALAAAVLLAGVPRVPRTISRDVAARLATLDRRFRSGAVYTAWPRGNVYFDDNEWIALDLLDWDALHPSAAARRKAAKIFAAVVRAWDPDPGKTCPGGVQWTNAAGNEDRNTVSTANGAVLALRLYLLTHRPSYLHWATQMLGWVDSCMLGPDGLYWDHVDGNGSVDQTEWSYNQGSVMEAYRLLYLATGDASDLSRAEAIADATLSAFQSRWSNGEPPVFAVIFFRRLLRLAKLDKRADYVAAAQTYADTLWATPRTTLLAQAALVQLYAALAAVKGGA
jgi:predicted alpha-1,6-mannanase (GH76 family)